MEGAGDKGKILPQITETPLYGVGNSNQGRVCILIPPFTEYQVYLDSSRDVRQTTVRRLTRRKGGCGSVSHSIYESGEP